MRTVKRDIKAFVLFVLVLYFIYVQSISARPALVEESVALDNNPRMIIYFEDIDYYFYNNLDAEQKKLYEEIYYSLVSFSDEIIVSTKDEALLRQTFEFVMCDHPEIFYVDGYKEAKYSLGDTTTKIGFIGNYTMTSEEINQAQRAIEDTTSLVVTVASEIQDEYDRAKYLYEYLIYETEYDLESDNNQNICSVFIDKKSVCQGYAKAYQFLLQKCGIEATLVSGYTDNNTHAWNLVKINGQYYYADPTWGDALYTLKDRNGENSVGMLDTGINYDYFLVTTNDLLKTHSFDNSEFYPECTSVSDNFYVKEGLMLNEWDLGTVQAIFDRAAQDNSYYVTIKCGNLETYEKLREELIFEQKIFELHDWEETSVAYAFDEEQTTFIVWF